MDRSMAEVGVLAHRTAVSFRFSPQKRNKGKKQTKQTNKQNSTTEIKSFLSVPKELSENH